MIQDFKNKTIMIVDDEPEILEIMTDMIKSQLDLNISTYTSSSAALESFKEGLLPNLILTDIKMPK